MSTLEKIREIRDKLKPVKELVAIIVFFIGGIIFAISYFVAQEHFDRELLEVNKRLSSEVTSLQCLLLSHVAILAYHDSETKFLTLRPELMKKLAGLEMKENSGALSQEEIVEREELRATLVEYDQELQTLKEKRDGAHEKMVAQQCQNGF